MRMLMKKSDAVRRVRRLENAMIEEDLALDYLYVRSESVDITSNERVKEGVKQKSIFTFPASESGERNQRLYEIAHKDGLGKFIGRIDRMRNSYSKPLITAHYRLKNEDAEQREAYIYITGPIVNVHGGEYMDIGTLFDGFDRGTRKRFKRILKGKEI